MTPAAIRPVLALAAFVLIAPPARRHAPAATSALRLAAPPAVVGSVPVASAGGNLRLNQDVGPGLQLETTVAIDPNDPDRVLFGAIDVQAAQNNGWYLSTDGARSVAATGVFPADSGDLAQGDPTLGFDAFGNAYYVDMHFAGGGGHLLLYRSSDGGATWPVRLPLWSGSSAHFPDKPFLAIDPRATGTFAGSLYVSFTGINAPPYGIGFLYSRDRGATWSNLASITPDVDAQVSMPAVGPGGEVHVVWMTPWRQPVQDIHLRTSTDGGVTFGPTRTVAGGVVAIPNDLRGLHTFSIPVLAIDTSTGAYRGRLHVVWSAFRGTTTDVWHSSSDDSGATWTPPAVVNDVGAGDQFNAWLCCDENGALFTAWYDRRDDPRNMDYHVYASASYDGGATWLPARRVTDTVSPLPRTGWLGDYIGLAARAGRTYPVWTDTRNNGNLDVYTAAVQTDLEAQPPTLSAAQGGVVDLPLRLGPAQARRVYVVLAGASGSAPGIDLGCGVRLHLAPDAVTDLSLRAANMGPFRATVGTTDARGSAAPAFAAPPGALSGLVGLELTFAAVVLGPPCLAAYGSNPVTVRIAP